MPVKFVFCEINPLTHDPVRIFKNTKDAILLPSERIARWPRGEAVKSIREQIFQRSCGKCEYCGTFIDRSTGEMHEQHPRGKLLDGKFGEISLDNSVFLCKGCHTSGPNAAHKDRNWHRARID